MSVSGVTPGGPPLPPLLAALLAGCCEATISARDGASMPGLSPRVDVLFLVEHVTATCPAAADLPCAGSIPDGSGSMTFRATHVWRSLTNGESGE